MKDVQDDLKRLREEQPHLYAKQSARLLNELQRLQKRRHRYAVT